MKQLKEHDQSRKFAQVLKKFPADLEVSWKRPVYRCVDPGWARPEHLISGEGSRKNGSRWMPPGQERVVYGSSSEIWASKGSLFLPLGIAEGAISSGFRIACSPRAKSAFPAKRP